MQNYKSPVSDGYHPIFFKSQWDTLGHYILNLVCDYFSNQQKIGDINQTLITLIPKCKDPYMVKQLRPISLCNVSYKIISKTVTQHLKAFPLYVVSNNQISFVAGRSKLKIFWLCKRFYMRLIILKEINDI